MKSLAAFIAAASLFAAAAGHATTGAGHADAVPSFAVGAEISGISLLPSNPAQARQPERTAFFWFIMWAIHCADHPDSNWCS